MVITNFVSKAKKDFIVNVILVSLLRTRSVSILTNAKKTHAVKMETVGTQRGHLHARVRTAKKREKLPSRAI